MKCGICDKQFPFDPDGVLFHALQEHGIDEVENLGYSGVVSVNLQDMIQFVKEIKEA